MKEVTPERLEELIDIVQTAQDEIAEQVTNLRRVAEELGDEHAKAYLIAHLEIAVEAGGYIHRDMTIPAWISEIRTRAYEGRSIKCEMCGYEGEPEWGEDEHGNAEEPYCPKCEYTLVEFVRA